MTQEVNMAQEATTQDTGAQEAAGTQDQNGNGQAPRTFDEGYVKDLRKESAGYRTKVSELETRLKEFEDRDKTDLERTSGERDTFRSRAETAEGKLARYDAASKAGLPIEHAHRITGTTPKELEEDAQKLAEALGGSGGSTTFDGGPRGNGKATADDPDTLIRRMAGRRV